MKKITLLPLLLFASILQADADTPAEPSAMDKVMAIIGKAGDLQRTFEYIQGKLIPVAQNLLPAMDKTMSCGLAKQEAFDKAPAACDGLVADLSSRGLALPLINFNQKLCLDNPLKKEGAAVTACTKYASFVTREARLAYSSTLTIYMMSLIMNGFFANKAGKVKGAIPSILEVIDILVPNSKKEWKAKLAAAQGSLTDMNNTFEAIMRALKKISESMMYAAKAAETKIEVAKKEAEKKQKEEELKRLEKANPNSPQVKALKAEAKKLKDEATKAEQAQQLADLNPFAPEPLEVGGDMVMEMPVEEAAPAEEPAAEEEAAPAEEEAAE